MHFYRLVTEEGEVLEIRNDDYDFVNYNRDEVLGIAFGEERPQEDPLGTDAWYFSNQNPGDKIDWHYYKAPGAPLNAQCEYTYGDINSMYWLVRLDSAASTPYLAIYSKRQPDLANHSSTYRSRWLWEIAPNSFTPGEWHVAWRGAEPPADVLPNVPRVQLYYNQFDSAGPRQDDEEIIYEVISSNSGASVGTARSAHAGVSIERTGTKDYYTFMLSGD